MKTVLNIKGNLLDFPANINVAVHCANAFCTMGSGIAAEVRTRFPEAYEADLKTEKGSQDKMGGYSFAKVGDKYIVNVYGQFDYGKGSRHVNYEHIATGVEKIFQKASNNNKKDGRKMVIGFPKLMGCGLAGGDWNIVAAMIHTYSNKYNVDAVIVDFNA